MTSFVWAAGNKELSRSDLPLIMGIVNVTPDSFSDGGQHDSCDAAVAHSLRLVKEGANILDVGGESTRPGSLPVSAEEELRRTIPVIQALSKLVNVPLSIDTTKAEVARQAINAGATIVNDISGLTFDAQMLKVCANSNVGICLMHIKGTPQTMQEHPVYQDVVAEVIGFLQERLQVCLNAGISAERICIDPGIGFGKTAEHNLELMQSLQQMRCSLQRPILVGHSRKRFLSRILGRDVEERQAGTTGVSIALTENGADLLRVHDVQATRDALFAWHMVRRPLVTRADS